MQYKKKLILYNQNIMLFLQDYRHKKHLFLDFLTKTMNPNQKKTNWFIEILKPDKSLIEGQLK
jgi:hypothetical protein